MKELARKRQRTKWICLALLQPPTDLNSRDYGAIGPLRAMLLKLHRPQDWQRFISLEHHNEERKALPVWKDDEKVVETIRENWNLGELFTAEEIFAVGFPKTFNGICNL
jgi:hypothetical protein